MEEPRKQTVTESDLLNTRDAAQYLGLSPATLGTWRSIGGGPPFVRYSARCVRYRRKDLDVWVASRVARNTADETEAERSQAEG